MTRSDGLRDDCERFNWMEAARTVEEQSPDENDYRKWELVKSKHLLAHAAVRAHTSPTGDEADAPFECVSLCDGDLTGAVRIHALSRVHHRVAIERQQAKRAEEPS